jgi:hypothetical protein
MLSSVILVISGFACNDELWLQLTLSKAAVQFARGLTKTSYEQRNFAGCGTETAYYHLPNGETPANRALVAN